MPRPDSQRIPEFRPGTKTYRGYMLRLVKGNYPSGNAERAVVRATPRQHAKAVKLVEAGTHWKDVKGTFMSHLCRAFWQDFGSYLDSQMYGET
jgi:hypothetical protein